MPRARNIRMFQWEQSVQTPITRKAGRGSDRLFQWEQSFQPPTMKMYDEDKYRQSVPIRPIQQ